VAAKKAPVIVWLRRDLRINDNPALQSAATAGLPVLVVYIDDTEANWSPGGASRWWLHHSLTSLNKSLKTVGNRLRVFSGKALPSLQTIIDETGADTLLWNRRYEPESIDCDSRIKKHFSELGVHVNSYPGNFCHEPWQVRRDGKHPYRVFTAYWRASLKHDCLPLTASIDKLQAQRALLKNEVSINSLGLLPEQNWDSQFGPDWMPGEANALKLLDSLLSTKLENYDTGRDIPELDGTSRLSPHLAFGEISPRQINAEIKARLRTGTLQADDNTESFLREIGWREFANHLLYHFPATTTEPLDSRFAKFPWRKVKAADCKPDGSIIACEWSALPF